MPNDSHNTAPDRDFCRSVLRLRVPVVVTLAHKTMSIQQVLNLVPGAMIQFEKPYESPMTVEVSDRAIAEGEIVKSGDRFGIRVGEILPPRERFVALPTAEHA